MIKNKNRDNTLSATINTIFGPYLSNSLPQAIFPRKEPTVNPTAKVPTIPGSKPLKSMSIGKNVNIFSLPNVLRILAAMERMTDLSCNMLKDGMDDPACTNLSSTASSFENKNNKTAETSPTIPKKKLTSFHPETLKKVKAERYPAIAMKGILPISPMAAKSLSILPSFFLSVCTVR